MARSDVLDAPIVFVVFGAAVRPDGSASPVLARRTLGALDLSRGFTQPRFLLTGGQGRFGPPEAIVMRDLLMAEGISAEAIELDTESVDTLESARCCAARLQAAAQRRLEGVERVVIVTSWYHGFRCYQLLRALGIVARIGRIPGESRRFLTHSGLYNGLREVAATPWDMLLLRIFHAEECRSPGKRESR